MTPRPPPSELLNWALFVLAPGGAGSNPALTVVAGDASNRRYFRAAIADSSYILVDAPPATEKNEAFLAVRELLAGAGVTVPALRGADMARGYLLLGDLGDRLLLPELTPDCVDGRYREAMDVLLQIAAIDMHGVPFPAYDESLLREELGRFSTWFVEALLGYSPAAGEQALIEAAFDVLVSSALEQPRVLVHRDFHSRNLMPQDGGGLGVIDFQDAVLGPITYDLVSLLRDCYIRWPTAQVQGWVEVYREKLQTRGHLPANVDAAGFLRWFDLMGLQRHIKVLGTFARLYLRDGKPAYLDDLPLVIRYVRDITAARAPENPALAEFQRWFDERLSPLIANQHWGVAA